MQRIVALLLAGVIGACTRSAPPPRRAGGDAATRVRPVSAARCHAPPPAVGEDVLRTLAARFVPTRAHGEPSIGPGCDRLGDRIDEIVLERGSGHGGSLELWRVRRAGDDAFVIRGIRYRGDSMLGRAATPPFTLARGTITRAQLADELERARAALSASVRELVPPDPPGMVSGFTAVVGSGDLHIVVRLVDDRGRVLEGAYTGYPSNGDQERQLGVVLAAEVLDRLTTLAPTGGPLEPEDRALFVARFRATVPRFDDEFHWWVTERYVDLARFLGTPEVVPGLLGRLTFAAPDRSKIDARRDALDALARITGWDGRLDEAGGRRSDEAAAAAYLERYRR